jgi:polyisoprenoid-binding protein YceI
MRKLIQISMLTLAAALLAGCPRPVRPPEEKPVPTPAPSADMRGARVYDVLPQESTAQIYVYRGGALSRLGHNHVITSRSLSGRAWIHPTFTRSGFELAFPVAELIVDDPEARKAAGAEFPAEVPQGDKDGTRKNMLRPEVLDAPTYPQVSLRAAAVGGSLQAPQITARITIRNASRDVEVPTKLSVEGDRLTASGEFDIQQTDFGIKPFTVALGALEVQDRLHITFNVIAKRTN